MDIVKHDKTLSRQDSKPIARIPKARLWTRLSPVHLFRVLRDTYVKGCVTFGNSSKVTALAQTSAFQTVSDDNSSFSRSNSRNVRDDVASAQELLDLSAKFTREVLEQESVQSGRRHLTAVITGSHGLTMADLQGYSGPLRKTGASGLTLTDLQGHSGPLRARPSFDAVPESEQYTDTNVSKIALETLFHSSALHPTDFLQSSSRRIAALDSHQLGLPPRHSDFTRGGSERPARRLHARYASGSVSHIAMSSRPLTPVTDMSTFREQSNGRKSYDLPRASSRRRERFGSMNSSISLKSSGSLSRPILLVDDLPRSRSGKANKPNPYSGYDTRLPSPAPTV